MSFVLGQIAFGENQNSVIADNKPKPLYDWDISLYHTSGGLKKQWFLGASDVSLRSIQFELNDRIMGAGTMDLSLLDFPIDADDYLIVRYQNEDMYIALVDNTLDPKGGKMKLVPFHTRFSEILISNDFSSGTTIKSALETIITENKEDTQINWVPGLVDIDYFGTITNDFSGYDTMKKAINDLVNLDEDKVWGVDASNNFVVYEPSADIDGAFFYNDDPAYSKINVKTNWNKIKATRYQVFKKNDTDGGESERIGEVGYGGSYPVLEIEDFVRTKEAKFNVSEVITSDTEALELAYENLKFETQIPQNIQVQNFKIDELVNELTVNPIGKKIKVQDENEIILRTIINCDALTDDDTAMDSTGTWSGVTLDSADFISGGASVTFSSGAAVYDFGREVYFNNPVKIGFMIKGSVSGNYLEFSTGDPSDVDVLRVNTTTGVQNLRVNTSSGVQPLNVSVDSPYSLWDVTKPANIITSGVWQYIEFEIISDSFRYFGVRFTDGTVSDVNIDRVQIYLKHRTEYEENIIKSTFKLMNNEQSATVDMEKLDLQANDVLFTATKRIERLEAIQQAI